MEYNYGNLIKVERMRRKMKQSVLARGICSISYLSKIENNQTLPSEEVLEMIFDKLDIKIPLYLDLSEKVDKIRSEIEEILKEAILTRTDVEKRPQIEKYLTNPIVNQSKDLYIFLLISLARFDMMPDGKGQHFIEVGWIEDQLDRDNKLRYLLMKSVRHFQLNEKEISLELLEQLNNQLATANIPDWEVADMRYIIGGLYYRCTDYLQAIENVKLALTYFKDNFYVDRIIECHLVIGLCYKRRKRYSDSLSHYERATKIASATDLKHYNGMIFNNMGDVYSLLGDQEKALSYFIDSLSYKTEALGKLNSILSLVEVYGKQDDEDGITKWLNEGYKIIDNQSNFEVYLYHFDVYKHRYQEYNQIRLIESLKKTVQYFESLDDYLYTNKYSLWLARELRKSGKYKLATEYYEKSVAIMSRWD